MKKKKKKKRILTRNLFCQHNMPSSFGNLMAVLARNDDGQVLEMCYDNYDVCLTHCSVVFGNLESNFSIK